MEAKANISESFWLLSSDSVGLLTNWFYDELTAPKKGLSERHRFRFGRDHCHTVSGNSRSVESQPTSPKNQLLSVL